MTPERWQQVTEIFHAAREQPPAARDEFLRQACGSDSSLRGEVDALLGAHDAAGSFGRTGSFSAMPHLQPGTSVGPYRVDALVGAGGMGEVYRATDTRLKRIVALKILGADLTASPQSRARFDREAQLLAALNHPHIAAIYGVEGTPGGGAALVLEYVEGPTLAERLLAGPLKVSEALPIARQIASALEAAHERGIVHRDLKPANIKITPAGQVKVLDFGIGKIADVVPAGITGTRTGTGLVLGTPAYMSPEQARGQTVDKRTDIWAFGCVLYEMLTGHGAFAAETASDSLAKVIEREPDWTALSAVAPESMRRLVRRCLQKDPADRLHDIADARIEISETQSAPDREDETPARRTDRTHALRWTLALVPVALVALLVWRLSVRPASPNQPHAQAMEFGVTFPDDVLPSSGVALSPDGRQVAAGMWTNSAQVWVHDFVSSQTRRLAGAEQGAEPFWSPDSSKIGFFRGNKTFTISATGGDATQVAGPEEGDSPGSEGSSGAWSKDDVILFSSRGGKLFRVPASGGAKTEVSLNGIQGVPIWPRFLPDGRHFIFFNSEQGHRGGAIELASLDSSRVTHLVDSDVAGAFGPPDELLFVRNASLMAQRLDLNTFALVGEPVLITSGVTLGVLGIVSQLMISASENGVLAFPESRGGSRGQLTWFDREGRQGESIEAPTDGSEYLNPAISPDGAFVLANRINMTTGAWDIWLLDIQRKVPTPLTLGHGSSFDPVWSPDGKDMVFASDRDGRLAFYRQSVAGGPATFVLDVSEANMAIPMDWTREGDLIYDLFANQGRSIWAKPLSGDRPPFKITGDTAPYSGRVLAPEDRWLAYNAYEDKKYDVFVRSLRGPETKVPISHGGGVHPRWTRGGKEIVYWAVPGGILANDVLIVGTDVRVGPPRTLLRSVLGLIDARSPFDVTADGARLLVRQPAGPQAQGIRVIVNWTSKLK